MKGRLIRHTKVRKDDGNIIEVKLWEVNPSADKPHGYKYSLVYVAGGERAICYDNGEGKGDHRHYRKSVERYDFKTMRQLIDDFSRDVEKYKMGKNL